MAEESFTVANNTAANRFEVKIGDAVAFADYKVLASGILFSHTEVPSALGGRGIAKALVRAGLKYARDHDLKVMPVCPFFANYIAEHPEEHDILHPDYRTALGL
ncbi:MAG: GNAT family N-acetyltransferase [Alphaproteobacteria bacterium]|nr:GNAT family N-acetyltransferase [Alphaproteobacteria bacterium]